MWDAVLKCLATVTMGPVGLDDSNRPCIHATLKLVIWNGSVVTCMPRSKPSTKSPGTLAPKQRQTESAGAAERGKLPPARVLKALPDSVRKSVVESAAFSGSLPPSAMYRAYDQALPGSAERILEMAEKEQDHRIEWEREALRQAPHQRRLGSLIALSSLAVAGVLAMYGHDWVAGIILCAGFAGTAVSFVRKHCN